MGCASSVGVHPDESLHAAIRTVRNLQTGLSQQVVGINALIAVGKKAVLHNACAALEMSVHYCLAKSSALRLTHAPDPASVSSQLANHLAHNVNDHQSYIRHTVAPLIKEMSPQYRLPAIPTDPLELDAE
eukprot:gene2130-3066_t